MSDDGDTEPSLLEYARFHGLAVDHLNQDIFTSVPLDLLPWPEDVNLPEFKVPWGGKLPPEPKFRLDTKAASLLASCLKPPKAPDLSNILSDHHAVKKLKMEPPVLKTDHCNDMWKLRFRKPAKVEVCNLAPLPMDEEESDRLEWLPNMMKAADSWDKKLADEKLQTTREVLKSLQDTLRPLYTPKMHEQTIAEDLAFEKVLKVMQRKTNTNKKQQKRPHTTSPPLLPDNYDDDDDDDDDDGDYFISSSALGMPLLCDGIDPDGERMRKVKEKLSNQTCIRTADAMPSTAARVEELLRIAESGPVAYKRNALEADEKNATRNLQPPGPVEVESPKMVPLTPADAWSGSDAEGVGLYSATRSINSKHAKFDDIGAGDIDQSLKADLLKKLGHGPIQSSGRDIMEAKLEASDDILPVDVPKLNDVNLFDPATPKTSIEPLQVIVEKHLEHTIQPVDEVAESKMKWSPIPGGLLTSPPREFMEPQPRVDEWISQPPYAIRSEDLLWRPGMLRVLTLGKDEEEEEELEEDPCLGDELTQSPQRPLKRLVLPDVPDESFVEQQPSQLSFMEPKLGLSNFGSLAAFMDTRMAHKKPRLDIAEHLSAVIGSEAMRPSDPNPKRVIRVEVPTTAADLPSATITAFSTPHVPHSTSPRSIIISTRLLKSHRQLTHQLKTRPKPALSIIYRDLGPDNDTSKDPDIIFSPTTAAILTTLQATTQRTLPGQQSSSPQTPIFNRILHLSQLYDHLFVLTTLPPQTHPSTFDSPKTCTQITHLTAFYSSISTSHHQTIHPILIPAPPPLFTYASHLIHHHALPSPLLLPSQTLWELFLLRAGLNPYAAQVVLGLLKRPTNPAPDGNDHYYTNSSEVDAGGEGGQGATQQQQQQQQQRWGLAAFIHMSPRERGDRFASLLGWRALERVGAALDADRGGGAGAGAGIGAGAGAGGFGLESGDGGGMGFTREVFSGRDGGGAAAAAAEEEDMLLFD